MTMGANLEESGTKSLDQEAMLERALSAFDLELPDPAAIEREAAVHLADATIPEHPEWIDDEARLRENHDLMFAQALAGTDRRYVGPGHVRMLRHLLTEGPPLESMTYHAALIMARRA